MDKPGHSVELADLQRMLSAVLTLCLLNGQLSDNALDALIESARLEARKKIRSLKPRRPLSIDLMLLGSILHRWNRSPKYLDRDARPFPIRATGPAPSIEALFRAEKRKLYFKSGLQDLLRAALVRKTDQGLYLPRRDSILLHSLTPEMVAHLALSMNRLTTTLLRNTAPNRRSKDRLIERNALVADLPKENLGEFIRFSREQGAALVSTMNDWLENRRLGGIRTKSSQAKRTMSAGIHVFAFCDEKTRRRG